MSAPRRRIAVKEYEGTLVPRADLPADVGEQLWRGHGEQITVEFPSPATSHRWRLTSQGWVGYVPVGDSHMVELAPRVALGNLFGMLEYAYFLRSFRFLGGEIHCATLAEFYERLAHVLARRVLDRARRGLHRSYVEVADDIVLVRGRIDVAQHSRAPWRARVPCEFEEHTSDIDDNAVLNWTLDRVVRSGLCTERSLPTIRAAHRRLAGSTTMRPFTGAECSGRSYSRLNADYAPMHGLCRFFLENSGPTHRDGERATLPFLVHMPRLFEAFVAAWIREHAAARYKIDVQRVIEFDGASELKMFVDVVLGDRTSGRARAVLDTKYKLHATPSPADVQQVVTYAHALGCQRAVLVYPEARTALRFTVGSVVVAAIPFAIDADLEQAGVEFLRRVDAFLAVE